MLELTWIAAARWLNHVRSQALRSQFVEGDDGAPRVRLLTGDEATVRVELGRMPVGAAAMGAGFTIAPGSLLHQEWSEFANAPFDLFTSRLLRVKVTTLSTHGAVCHRWCRFPLWLLKSDVLWRAAKRRKQSTPLHVTQNRCTTMTTSTAPTLLPMQVWDVGSGEHLLVIVVQHTVMDGWASRVFQRELAAVYAATAAGGGSGPKLAPLPVQYSDYAVWQRQHLAGASLEAELAWWKQNLAGAPPLLELPTDRPRPGVFSHYGGRVPVTIDAGTCTALSALAAARRTTPFVVLLTVLQASPACSVWVF